MRNIVGFAELYSFAPQYRIGCHDVEIKLAERPVAGILLGGEVKHHTNRKRVRDGVVRVLVERAGSEILQQRDGLINPRLCIRKRTGLFCRIAPFIEYFVNDMSFLTPGWIYRWAIPTI